MEYPAYLLGYLVMAMCDDHRYFAVVPCAADYACDACDDAPD
jgi:hypothetical protein